MSAVAATPRRISTSRRLLTSLPVAALWLWFAYANFDRWQSTHVPVGLGAMVLELVTAVLFVVRRDAVTTNRSALAWSAAMVGSFGTVGARPHYAPVAGLEPLYMTLQLVGACVAMCALLSLGRSFGLVAANRGVRTSGLYRFVRHPVYAAYLLSDFGYALENPSLRNVVLLVLIIATQGVRIAVEERWLLQDPAYRSYAGRVRWRLVPFLV